MSIETTPREEPQTPKVVRLPRSRSRSRAKSVPPTIAIVDKPDATPPVDTAVNTKMSEGPMPLPKAKAMPKPQPKAMPKRRPRSVPATTPSRAKPKAKMIERSPTDIPVESLSPPPKKSNNKYSPEEVDRAIEKSYHIPQEY